MTDTQSYQRFFAELKRRQVFRVMAVYGIVGFTIIEAAGAIFPRIALPDWTVTLIVWLALLGFPVAIVLAWSFDLTPEGLRRTAEATPGELTEILAAPASKRWLASALALVGLAALLAGAWYAGRQSAPTSGVSSASIAVLPFADMSPNNDQEYFSDGISEELLNLLAKIPELQVAARTSSFSFKGENLEIPEIAERLHVANVLEGSVRKSGNEVRITAQLIRADDGFHMWSETWDRPLNDIFAIQDEIAADVVEQLKVSLLDEAPTVEEANPEAFALYLQARQLMRQRTPEAWKQSEALYQRAVGIDSEYAAAWIGLARVYGAQASYGLRPKDEGYTLARDAADRALEIDPEYAEAYAYLGQFAHEHENDLALAARHLERALELDPTNPVIVDFASGLALYLGRVDEAVALVEYLVAHDPVNAHAHYVLGITYYIAGDMDKAIASFRTEQILSPERIQVQYNIGIALLLRGEPEAALAAIENETFEAWRLIGLSMAYHVLGRASDSDAALELLIEEYELEGAYNIAEVYAFRGEADLAFEWLNKAVEYNDPGVPGLTVEPLFANIHDDPRWMPFLESIGKSPEQMAAIEFEVTLPH